MALEGGLETRCAEKTVGIAVVVAEDGSLASARVISSSSIRECDDVALSAVMRARFKAAIASDGKPVEARFFTSVRFPAAPGTRPPG